MRTSLLQSLVLVGLAGGCTGQGQIGYSGQVSAPELVVVSPGVQVIADYDEPIFYSDNYYWRNDGGVWYRSQYHTRGWVRYDAAPVQVRSIERPSAYIHYHGGAEMNVRDHRESSPPPPPPEVRDHREAMPPPPPPEVRDHREAAPPPPPPVVRDHRDGDNEQHGQHGNDNRDHHDNGDHHDNDHHDNGDHKEGRDHKRGH